MNMSFKKIFSVGLLISFILTSINTFAFGPLKNYFYLFIISIPLFLLTFDILNKIKIYEFIEKNSDKFFLVLIVLSIFILYRAGLFSEGPIAIQDYPIHYFVHWFMKTIVLPIFKSTNGMCLNYQLGYSPLYDYPPGAPILSATLYYISFGKIPFWAIFRFVVGLSFVLSVFSVYFLTKKLKFPSTVSLLASIFWLAWFHGYFLDGTFISYYAFSFSLFSLYFFIDYFESKKNTSLALSSIFSALTLLFQSMFFPFLLVCLFLYSLLKFKIKPFFFTLFLTLPLGAVYFTSIYNWWNYISAIFSIQPKIFPHQYDINIAFLKQFYILSNFTVFFSLPLLVLPNYKKFNSNLPFLFVAPTFLILLTFLLNFIQTNSLFFEIPTLSFVHVVVNFFLIERIIFFIRVFFDILAAFSIYLAFKLQRKIWNKLLIAAILSLMSVFIFFYFYYLMEAWHISNSELFKSIYNWTLEEWYSLKFDDGVLRNSPKDDVLELFTYLKENTNNSARILVEDSRWGKLGGNIMAMSAYYTQRYFVGGLYQGVMIEGDSWAVDGIFFGKNITDYEIDDLEEKLKLFNIGWVVTWTDVGKSYFGKAEDKFELLHETKNKIFKVYLYKDSPFIYVETKRSKAKLVNLNNDSILVKIEDGKKGEKVTLKFRYEKDWHAYVNGKEIPIFKDGILMSVYLPEDGNYNLFLKYKESVLLSVGKIISFVSFFLIFLYLLKDTSLVKSFKNHFIKLSRKFYKK